MDVKKLFFVVKFGRDWIDKWLSEKNIEAWEEMEESKKIPGETFKDYRIRLSEVSRKAHQLRKKNEH